MKLICKGFSMLELRDLVKVYKAKGGAEVRALDGVSIRFEEKGMVFLLGKSGSGKSTLLNLCGGLDAPDAGEIIIKGRSSKDFTQSDFDSYRNTFLGFVFQDYNILEEFTVEENIALALELQGKNKNKEQVEAILEQVDLAGLAKRKPNTLSGGQRQRIAIARALVKDPEIIMADEPTGALDSTTGKQVFDTLKKLSREKLVIVVSHDREFAETYADRIIELKDGKIISDMTKSKVDTEDAGKNVRFVGNDTISIKSGTQLTADDLTRINAFLSSVSEDVIITSGKQEIEDFRKATHIDAEGARETFEKTDENAIAAKAYTPEDSRFIRSKLPLRHAVRIGASSMKIKPFRLAFTILLSFIAFTMFGLFSTLTFFSKAATSLQTYRAQDYEMLTLQNNYRYDAVSLVNGEERDRTEGSSITGFTQADYEEFVSRYGNGTLGVWSTNSCSVSNTGRVDYRECYYDIGISGFAAFDETATFWTDRLLTDTDVSALGPDEVIISSYLFDSIAFFSLYETSEREESIPLESYRDILGKTIYISVGGTSTQIPLTVRGVYRCEPNEKFDSLRGYYIYSEETTDLIEQFKNDLNYAMYSVALVSEDFYEQNASSLKTTVSTPDYGFRLLGRSMNMYGRTDRAGAFLGYAHSIAALPQENGSTPAQIARFDGKEAAAPLSAGETVVPFSLLSTQFQTMGANEQLVRTERDGAESADAWYDQFREAYALLNSGSSYDPNATDEDYAAAIRMIFDLIESAEGTSYAFDATIYGSFERVLSDEAYELTVVGFYYGDMNADNSGGYLSAEDYAAIYAASFEGENVFRTDTIRISKYDSQGDVVYRYIIVPVPESNGLFRTLLRGDGSVDASDDTFYSVRSVVAVQIDAAQEIIDTLEMVFLWIGVVVAIFAMLLLFNFISVSITHKKKEIGILRAVGARSTDVFKIFYAESAIITIICYVLAVIASYIVCGVLNSQLASLVSISIFVFGPLSWLVMLAIAVGTSFIATFLPVHSIAKRKPVESIRSL